MVDEKKILEDMLVDESDIIQNLAKIVEKAKNIFVMEKNSGKIIFKNFSELTNPQKIVCILTAKYFAKRLNLIVDHAISVADISNELEIPNTTLSSPLKSLRKTGVVLYNESLYKINPHRIEEVVDSILSTKTKN